MKKLFVIAVLFVGFASLSGCMTTGSGGYGTSQPASLSVGYQEVDHHSAVSVGYQSGYAYSTPVIMPPPMPMPMPCYDYNSQANWNRQCQIDQQNRVRQMQIDAQNRMRQMQIDQSNRIRQAQIDAQNRMRQMQIDQANRLRQHCR